MTKKDFMEIMNDIALAYNGKFALNPAQDDEIKKSVVVAWYKYLGEFEKDAFRQIADHWIKKEPKAPAISDLYPKTKEVSDRIKKANEPEKEIPIPTEWDFQQTYESKEMTYEEWIAKYFGDRK